MNPVYFNDFNLETIWGLKILNKLPHRFPSRAVDSQQLANTDGAKVVAAHFKTREIPFEGVIAASTRDAAENLRDQLMVKLTPKEAVLKFQQAGAWRQYIATVSDIMFSEVQGGLMAFTVTFLCSDPVGYDPDNTIAHMGANFTTTPKTFSIYFGGSYFALPYITMTFNAVTGATSKQVTLSNTGNGDELTIQRTFANADVLVVDCKNKVLTVNGSEVDFLGRFLTFEPGFQTLQYEDTFSTRNVTPALTFQKRWL